VWCRGAVWCRGVRERAGLATVTGYADVAQLVEHHLAKVRVAGSNPVVRSKKSPVRILKEGPERVSLLLSQRRCATYVPQRYPGARGCCRNRGASRSGSTPTRGSNRSGQPFALAARNSTRPSSASTASQRSGTRSISTFTDLEQARSAGASAPLSYLLATLLATLLAF